ncbi:MAG: cell wall hydrolase [Brevundimonas subvibrioides]|uniref:Cell wall hydrolase n=1 Tax=Brevundimonas subvibrioides TaxID=74313 RepID=A0A258HEV8_9CAUL|nr:cell wall hydrolase [Brevundimonas subvibrioides]OYX55525.1 MAG: cell wall hydrolase [Brevundimonas subvibrioides]
MSLSAIKSLDWHRVKTLGRRYAAAAPAALAALGVAMAASSTARPIGDRTAEAVARVTEGDLSARGLAALSARMDPAQLALAIRFDPNEQRPALLGLTPGWESLTLAGRPTLELGVNGLDAQKRNAAMPAAIGALRSARPFVLQTAASADRARALRCLTQGVYYEAALESTEGQEAVAQVILNRVRDPNYPNTVCGVVFEGAERTTGCQFSFTCDGALSQAPVGWAWNRARTVAERALSGYVAIKVGTATHYHADYVHPWWSPTLAKITQIGAHIFYRWKGLAGETVSFKQTYAGHEPVIDEARFSRPRLITASAATGEAGPDDATVLAQGGMNLRTVQIDGQTRVVGVASLGGRRQATAADIAAINARLQAFEAPAIAAAPAAAPPPPGVITMDVEEVGRPAN